ncbi:MAG: hypothetical protein ACOCX4_10375 [Planctomycetota bacterium]
MQMSICPARPSEDLHRLAARFALQSPAAVLLFVSVLAVSASARGGEAAAEAYPNPLQKAVAQELDLTRWETDKGVDEIVPLPDGKGNAAVHYARLRELYKEDRKEGSNAVRLDAKGLSEILAGAKLADCSLAPDHFPPMETFRPETVHPVIFLAYADALVKAANKAELAMRAAEAERYLRALIVLGWHLTEDRPDIGVYSLGLTLQAKGVGALEKFATRQMDMPRANRCRDYRKFLFGIMKAVAYKSKFLLGKWEDFRSLYACAVCAEQDADPVWRQEAAVNLGVLQNGWPSTNGETWNTDAAQQARAREALQRMANEDPVPSIRVLAKWCLDTMTPDKIREWREASQRPPAAP